MNAQQAVKEILAEYEAGKRKPCTIEHTAECDADERKWREALHEYVIKWPRHCQVCDGTGNTEYWEDVIGEPWSSSQPFYEPCDDCLAVGKCPRCGTEVWTEDDFDGEPVTCPACNWSEENPDAAPYQPECFCWEQDAPDELSGNLLHIRVR